MKHYAIDQWADCTRGLLADREQEQMQAHLVGGCLKCRVLWDFTTKLGYICDSIATSPVPESALRLARAIFPVQVHDRPQRGNRLPIELIFDSFLVPSPVGLRTSWQIGWQGLYRAGDCSLDLRFEPELNSSRAAVIGQIANRFLPQESLIGPVLFPIYRFSIKIAVLCYLIPWVLVGLPILWGVWKALESVVKMFQ